MTRDLDVQYFTERGRWKKPDGAVSVDVILKGGQGSAWVSGWRVAAVPPGYPGAPALRMDHHGLSAVRGEDEVDPFVHGELVARSFAASELPDGMGVEVGVTGFVMIVTHLEDS